VYTSSLVVLYRLDALILCAEMGGGRGGGRRNGVAEGRRMYDLLDSEKNT